MHDFYNFYAGKIGFSVCRSNCHYVGTDKIIESRKFCCSHQGTGLHYFLLQYDVTKASQ
jgi:hypothetical protein